MPYDYRRMVAGLRMHVVDPCAKPETVPRYSRHPLTGERQSLVELLGAAETAHSVFEGNQAAVWVNG